MGVARKLQTRTGASVLGIGLQKSRGKKFFRIQRRRAGSRPAGIQQMRPRARGSTAQLVSNLSEASRAVLFDNGEETREGGDELHGLQWSG